MTTAMAPPLVTYFGDAGLKTAFLAEIDKHEQQDALIKGSYGEMNGYFKGCAIGCSLNSLNVLQGKPALYKTNEHERLSAELGWPIWLAYVQDHIFENIPDDLAKAWPRRLADAIPVGVTVPDLVLVKLARWALIHEQYGIVHVADSESVKTNVRTMGALFDRTIDGDVVPEAEWNDAFWPAWDAWAAREAWPAWDVTTRDAFYSALSEEVLRLLRELQPKEQAA